MQAVLVRELIGPDGAEFTDTAEPERSHWLANGERMLVEVHAAAISCPDVLQTRGALSASHRSADTTQVIRTPPSTGRVTPVM
jgi:NADPH:quinone reductase-like Zn-dependent oxidoreductase